ncbi:MAG: hypothetical protein JNM25_05050 [Planctomycetes bacterium]|nr:hypothetical protein [Planctomycetota bacterium]
MPPLEGDGWDAPLLEGVLWVLLLVFASVRTWRAPPDERPGWWLVAGGLLLIVVDKAFDVHAVAHAVGTWIAVAIDPEHQLRGPNAGYRDAALVGGFVVACAAAAWWLRRDARVGTHKLLCLGGLALVGALLAARLMPQLEKHLPDWLTKAIELAAWSLVLAGLWLGGRRAGRPRPLIDGFL